MRFLIAIGIIIILNYLLLSNVTVQFPTFVLCFGAQFKMAEDKERISQSSSYVLVNRQLQDLVRTQNTAIVKLQCMVGKICLFGFVWDKCGIDNT